MYVYRAQADMPASTEIVWAVLTDFSAYPAWNPFTVQVGCSLVVGTPVVMDVVLLGTRTLRQTEILREVVPEARLVWALDIGLPWLLAAERVQTLEPHGDGTRYLTVDTVSGLLSPLVHLLFGRAVGDGFIAMAAALAQRVREVGSQRAGA